jgi:DNA-damage-inducible protein J
MKSVNVTIRVDEDIKKQADALFDELGMSLSTAFNIFLRQSVREQGLPFPVTRHVPNALTLAAMDAAEKGEDVYGPFDSVDELMEALHAYTGIHGPV